MTTFPSFEQITRPRLDDLKIALARTPWDSARSRTPEDWLDEVCLDNAEGLVTLHLAYADYVASVADDHDVELFFRDWVWLVAHALYAPG